MVALKGQIEMVEVATANSDNPKVVRMWPVDAREAMRIGSHVALGSSSAAPAEPKAKEASAPASPEQVANLTKSAPAPAHAPRERAAPPVVAAARVAPQMAPPPRADPAPAPVAPAPVGTAERMAKAAKQADAVSSGDAKP